MVSGRVSHFTYRIQDQSLILESSKNLATLVRGDAKDDGKHRRIIAECWGSINIFHLETKHVQLRNAYWSRLYFVVLSQAWRDRR